MTDPLVFLREFARARAEQVLEQPFGFVVRSRRRFPHAHDHNLAWVFRPVAPTDLLATLEREFADVDYRRAEIATDVLTDDLAAALLAAGYAREDEIVMRRVRPPDPDRPAPTGVSELSLEQRVAVAAEVWADTDAAMPADVGQELAGRAHSAVDAAQCTFLAVVGDDGRVQTSCDLIVRGDIAQIEEVSTLTSFRGRGNASRVVLAAAERARSDRPDREVFLLAEADDWPRRLYGRLGFDVTATHTVWSRVSDR